MPYRTPKFDTFAPSSATQAKLVPHVTDLVAVDLSSLIKAPDLFPNAFDENNFLKGGQDFKFPPEGAKYRFRFTTPGTETVAATCSVEQQTGRWRQGRPNSRGFTDLGDHDKLLTRSIEVEGAAPPPAKPTAPPAPGVAPVAQVRPIARAAIILVQ